jgi:hypothetical protein
MLNLAEFPIEPFSGDDLFSAPIDANAMGELYYVCS